jgi:hypothetical protein
VKPLLRVASGFARSNARRVVSGLGLAQDRPTQLDINVVRHFIIVVP